MTEAAIWLTEGDIASLLSLNEAIDTLEAAMHLEARSAASNMLKTHVAWGSGHTLHAIGAVFPEEGFAGTKTWAHTAGGASPLLLLFDSHSGALLAIIEAFALGQLRTGGISGVATRWMAGPDADELAIIGTGKQAFSQVAAVLAVRAVRRVRVFSPTAAHRVELAARLHHELGVDSLPANSVAEAVANASIVTLVTRAREPIVNASMLSPGTHINAVGAITPERMELNTDVFPRCGLVVADCVPAAQRLSHELMLYYDGLHASRLIEGRTTRAERASSDLPMDERNQDAWQEVVPLSRIVDDQRRRPCDADLTVFKAMGMGISDLALAIEAYRRARRRGLGRHIGPYIGPPGEA